MEQYIAQNAWWIVLLALWTIPWKGVALWRAARSRSVAWFVVLLIINTLGILDIIYIFFFSGKNPEKIVVMQGEALLNWKDIQSNAEGSLLIKAPALVEIDPYAWHEVISKTDIIIFEMNGLEDAKEDTFRL